MNTPPVVLSGVSKQYAKQYAVRQIDLALETGQCIGLVGHNGAGKSTIIKLILGLIAPTQGKVSLLGKETGSKTGIAMRSRIGYLPETVALHGSLTGKETLDFYARLKKQPLKNNSDLLARVGIAQAAHRRVGTYSKGMRQRLALAQALLGTPKVMLLDEPTTGLDPASRQMFYRIIQELKEAGTAVLLSTHALSELDGHADRIVVMKNGSKLADGSMNELQIQSGLPVNITVRLNQDLPLSNRWQAQGELSYRAECRIEEKMSLLHELGDMNRVDHIDIHTPTLDDMYAEFLKREDI